MTALAVNDDFPDPGLNLDGLNDATLRFVMARAAGLLQARRGTLHVTSTLASISDAVIAQSGAPTMANIHASVAAHHGLDSRELRHGHRLKREWAHARQEAMWRMRRVRYADGHYRFSLNQIGGFYRLDHTTVLFGIRQHEQRRLNAGADQ